MTNYIHILQSTAVAALFVASTSCSQQVAEESMPTPTVNPQVIQPRFLVEEGNRLIPYADYWNSASARKSSPSRAAANGPDDGFYLYGWLNSKDIPDGSVLPGTTTETSNTRIFDRVKTSKTGAYEGVPRYWMADAITRHSFAAIAGLGSGGNEMSQGFTTAHYVPVCKLALELDPQQQTDLLLAYGPVNMTVVSVVPTVNIYFRHALAKAMFKVMVKGGATLYETRLTVEYGDNCVPESAEYYYTGKLFKMGTTFLSQSPDAEYQVNATDKVVPASASNEVEAVELGDIKLYSDYTYPEGWLKLILSYSLMEGGARKTLSTRVPTISFPQGSQTAYYLLVNDKTSSLTISNVELEAWTTETPLIDPLN